MVDAACVACQYCAVKASRYENHSYECRRHPPNAQAVGADNMRLWPQVKLDDWCGEFKLRGSAT